MTDVTDLWTAITPGRVASRAAIDDEVAAAVIQAHRFTMEFFAAAGCVVAHPSGAVFGPYDSMQRRFVRDHFWELFQQWANNDEPFSDVVERARPPGGSDPGRCAFSQELDDTVIDLVRTRWPHLSVDAIELAIDALNTELWEVGDRFSQDSALSWPAVFRRSERDFEDWLSDHLHLLTRVGWQLELLHRQWITPDRTGRVDLLCRCISTGPLGAWPGDLVVIENKATEWHIEDLDQLDRYRAAVQSFDGDPDRAVFGIVLADGPGDRASAAVADRPGIHLVTWAETGFWDYQWFNDDRTPLADHWCGTTGSQAGRPRGPTPHRKASRFGQRSFSGGPPTRRYRFVPPSLGTRPFEVNVDAHGNIVSAAADATTLEEIETIFDRVYPGGSLAELTRWFKPQQGWIINEVDLDSSRDL